MKKQAPPTLPRRVQDLPLSHEHPVCQPFVINEPATDDRSGGWRNVFRRWTKSLLVTSMLLGSCLMSSSHATEPANSDINPSVNPGGPVFSVEQATQILNRLAQGASAKDLYEKWEIVKDDESHPSRRLREGGNLARLRSALHTLRSRLNSLQTIQSEADLLILGEAIEDFHVAHALMENELSWVEQKLRDAGLSDKARKAEATHQKIREPLAAIAALTTSVMDASEQVPVAKAWSEEDVLGARLDLLADYSSLLMTAALADGYIAQLLKAPDAMGAETWLRSTTLPSGVRNIPARALDETSLTPVYELNSDSYPGFGSSPEDISPIADFAPFTDEILSKAAELDYDYVRLYEYVHNNVSTEWYMGSGRGAVGALRAGKGNDVDQAGLLIALLRASGVPSRFVHGVIELPVEEVAASLAISDPALVPDALRMAGIAHRAIVRGGRVAAIAMEHTWVAAKVPYNNYRGALIDANNPVWIPLDPSIKSWQPVPAVGALRQALGVKSSRAWVEDLIRVPQSLDLLAQLREQVKAQLLISTPEEYQALLGSSGFEAETPGLLPNSLPYPVLNVFAEAADLDARFQTRVEMVVRDSAGQVSLGKTLSLAALSSGRLTLSFQPATQEDHRVSLLYGGMDLVPIYMIDVRPSLKLDGEQIAIGTGIMQTGTLATLEITLKNGAFTERVTKHLYTPAYHAISFGHGVPTRHAALTTDEESEAARQLDGLTRAYMQKWTDAEEELAALNATPVVRPLPAISVSSTAFATVYLSDIPYTHKWKGVTLDAVLRVTEPVGTTDARRDFVRLSSLQGSMLEHQVFEEQFLVESVSSDKVLALSEQPPLTLDSTNVDTVSASMDVDETIRDELRAMIQMGHSILVSDAALQHNIWNGYGWWVEDPVTGSSGWYISGRLAGGSTTEDPTNWLLQFLAGVFANAHSAAPNQNPGDAASIRIVGGADGQRGVANQPLSSFSALVQDEFGSPVEGAEVVFSILEGNGSFQGSGASAAAVTDATGIASSPVFVPSKSTDVNPIFLLRDNQDEYTTQVGRNYIDARVQSVAKGTIALEKPVVVYVLPDQATRLTISNDPATSELANSALSITLLVTDQYGNPVSNVPVTASSGAVSSNCQDTLPSNIAFSAMSYQSCSVNVAGKGCGTASLELTSGTRGSVGFNVILGDAPDSIYTAQFSGAGQTVSHTVKSYGSCRQGPYLFYAYSYPANKFGQEIAASPPGVEWRHPTSVSLYYVRPEYRVKVSGEKYYLEYQSKQKVYPVLSFGDAYGNNIRAMTTGSSTLDAYLTPGPVPAYNTSSIRISQVVYLYDDINSETGEVTETEGVDSIFGGAPSIWGVELNIDAVESLLEPGSPRDPGLLYVNDFGRSEYPAYLKFSIQPDAYPADYGWVSIYEDGVLYSREIWTGNRLYPQTSIPQGTPINVKSIYTAEAALNPGSLNEIVSEPWNIPLNSRIVRDYTRHASLRTDVDLANGRSCLIGAAFEFTLNVDAVITLTATALSDDVDPQPTGSPVYLISEQTYELGQHSLSLAPDILLPRRNGYLLELKARSLLTPGEVEQHEGRLGVKYMLNDALPVQQTLVKGVNVKSGRMVVPGPGIEYAGRGPQLAFLPMYSSAAGGVGSMGRNWTHNFDASLNITNCGDVVIQAGDGGSMRFFPAEQGTFVPAKGYHGTLHLDQASNIFTFFAKGGTRYEFEFGGGLFVKWRLKSIIDPNHNRLKLEYNKEGYLTSVTDDTGRMLTYKYKSMVLEGKSVSVLTEVKGSSDQSIALNYDSNGNVTQIDKNDGAWVEQYAYDLPLSMATELLMTSRNVAGHLTVFDYDETELLYQRGGSPVRIPDGRVKKITAPDGGATRFAYATERINDPQTTVVTDENGHATTYETNAYGSVVRINAPAGLSTMTWNDDNLDLLSRTDPGGITTTYSYDAAGNITEETRAGVTVKSKWLIQSAPPYIKNRLLSRTDGNGHTTTYTLDAQGNVLGENRPEGAVTTYTYSELGDRLTATDGRGGLTRYTWNTHGMPLTQTDPLGRTTSFTHDLKGRLTAQRDPAGATTSHEYDVLDRVLKITDAQGGSTQLGYDAHGNKTTETDALGRTTHWTHDRMGRVLTHSNPMGQKVYTYDLAGNKKTETNWRTQPLASYDYDAANRLITRTGQSQAGSSITSYTYDAAGNLATEVDALGHSTAYEYDSFGRRIRITDALSGVTEMEYDNNGNLIHETDARGYITSHHYDALNRRVGSEFADGATATFEYDAADNLVSETRPMERITTRTFDAASQMVKLTNAEGKTTDYQYDTAGNLIREIDARLKAREYQYDSLKRLITTRDGEGYITRYEYDRVGNLIKETQPNGNVREHRYDALNNRIETTDSLARIERRDYDADGNLTSETDANGNITTHTYDEQGQRIASQLPAL